MENPFSAFEGEIDTFREQFSGNDDDWKLLCDYLKMPILDVESINDMQITQKQRNRLYYLLKRNAIPLGKLLRTIGYECFFAELLAFHQGNPSYQSLNRPLLIGDDTKQAKPEAKLMEYLTFLFCPAEGKKLPCYNIVVIIATFGDKKWEILLDMELWRPKGLKQHRSKPKMLKEMVEALHKEANSRSISLAGVFFTCDAAYQRSNELAKAVMDASFFYRLSIGVCVK
jgi:hypothetical protein